MNYKKIHDQIIDRAKDRILEGYKERHHIIPKCMGGDNSKENLVYLTAREHFLVHWLLTEIYPGHKGLIFAFWLMCRVKNLHQSNRYIPSSKIYEHVKRINSVAISELLKGHVGYWKGKSTAMKGRCHSEESKKKMSDSAKLRRASPETKKKMSLQRRGKSISVEHRQSISKANSGKNNPSAKSIIVDGILYNTYREAAKELGLSEFQISWRLKSKSPQFANYTK